MPAIMADNDVQLQFDRMLGYLHSPTWKQTWLELNIRVESFRSLALSRQTPDVELWKICQDRQIILVTGNRNADDPDSLEVTIRQMNTATSLPVITLTRPRRVLESKAYLRRTTEKLLDYLIDIERFMGGNSE